MKKIAITFFTIAGVMFLTSQGIDGQEITQSNCRPPELRGIRLGMSTEQVLALFPRGNKRREIQSGLEAAKTSAQTVYLGFDPATDSAGDAFAGVDSVSIGLGKGHVVDFSLQYVGQTWGSIDEWVTKLSESLKLPSAQAWAPGSDETPSKFLKCQNNEVVAAIQGGGASIRVRDLEGVKNSERSSAREERKRREEFKP